jgi:HAD superfamily, subfamily IIIB (Acid phosphatase)
MKNAQGKPKAVVWDLDGTLSDDRARAHYVEVRRGKARDWKSYFDAIDADPPIAASMEVLRAMHAAGIRILFLTGRPEYTRPKTERWLKANGLTEYDRLLMRPPGEFRKAGAFKVDEIARLRREYELVCAFEDRRDVADALREAGLPVFLYGGGALAAAESLEAEEASDAAPPQGDLFGGGADRDDDEEDEDEDAGKDRGRAKKRPAARSPSRAKPARGVDRRKKAAPRAKGAAARKAAERGKARAAKSVPPTKPGAAKKDRAKDR